MNFGPKGSLGPSPEQSKPSGDMTYINGMLGGTLARVAGTAGTVLIDGILVGAEVAVAGSAIAVLGGVIIAGAVGYAAYKALN